MIQDRLNRGAANEPINSFPEWIFASFESTWSWIVDLDTYHSKGTHPLSLPARVTSINLTIEVCATVGWSLRSLSWAAMMKENLFIAKLLCLVSKWLIYPIIQTVKMTYLTSVVKSFASHSFHNKLIQFWKRARIVLISRGIRICNSSFDNIEYF